MWAQRYDWSGQGDEWSSMWGNAEAQWCHTLHPRIARWLPAGNVLEIAPGYGRWAQFLIRLSQQYMGIDMAENAVDACKRRFATEQHARFVVNDGRSLEAVPAEWADLVFSFDSLVHVERDDMQAYLGQLVGKLAPGGHAFLHHSNLAMYPARGLIRWDDWRARSVSADTFRKDCNDMGLRCVSQELIPWQRTRFIDCISVVEAAPKPPAPGSSATPLPVVPTSADTVVVMNPYFSLEGLSARRISRIYHGDTPSQAQVADNTEGRVMGNRDEAAKWARGWLSFLGAALRGTAAKNRLR